MKHLCSSPRFRFVTLIAVVGFTQAFTGRGRSQRKVVLGTWRRGDTHDDFSLERAGVGHLMDINLKWSPSPYVFVSSRKLYHLKSTKNENEVRNDAIWAQYVQSFLLVSIPFAAMVASFHLYPIATSTFHDAIETLSDAPFSPVDGGVLKATVIGPAINGIVMPVISLLFASQVSTIGSTLRQRQLTVHTSLNKETEDVRVLFFLIDLFPPGPRERLRSYLQQYVAHLSEESATDVDWSGLRPKDDALLAVLNELHNISANKSSDGGDDSNDTIYVSPGILSESYSAMNRIMSERAARITALQTFFPPLQIATIAILSVLISLVFFIETDQNILLFLGSFELKVIWSMLIGMFAAVLCVVYDLSNPFGGTYQIPQIIDDELIPWNTDPSRDSL